MKKAFYVLCLMCAGGYLAADAASELREGVGLIEGGLFAKARPILQGLIDKDPDSVVLNRRMAQICEGLGEKEKALAHYQKVVLLLSKLREPTRMEALIHDEACERIVALGGRATPNRLAPPPPIKIKTRSIEFFGRVITAISEDRQEDLKRKIENSPAREVAQELEELQKKFPDDKVIEAAYKKIGVEPGQSLDKVDPVAPYRESSTKTMCDEIRTDPRLKDIQDLLAIYEEKHKEINAKFTPNVKAALDSVKNIESSVRKMGMRLTDSGKQSLKNLEKDSKELAALVPIVARIKPTDGFKREFDNVIYARDTETAGRLLERLYKSVQDETQKVKDLHEKAFTLLNGVTTGAAALAGM